jgi:hypothetical protein
MCGTVIVSMVTVVPRVSIAEEYSTVLAKSMKYPQPGNGSEDFSYLLTKRIRLHEPKFIMKRMNEKKEESVRDTDSIGNN